MGIERTKWFYRNLKQSAPYNRAPFQIPPVVVYFP